MLVANGRRRTDTKVRCPMSTGRPLMLEDCNMSGIRGLSLGANRRDSALQDRPLEAVIPSVPLCLCASVQCCISLVGDQTCQRASGPRSNGLTACCCRCRCWQPHARAEKEPPSGSCLFATRDSTESSFQLTRCCWTRLPLLCLSPPHQVRVRHTKYRYIGDGPWAMGTTETGGPSRLGQSSLDVSLSEPRPPDSQYTAPLAAVLQPPAFRTRQGGFKAGLPLYRLSLTGPTTHDVNRQRVHSVVDMHPQCLQ